MYGVGKWLSLLVAVAEGVRVACPVVDGGPGVCCASFGVCGGPAIPVTLVSSESGPVVVSLVVASFWLEFVPSLCLPQTQSVGVIHCACGRSWACCLAVHEGCLLADTMSSRICRSW